MSKHGQKTSLRCQPWKILRFRWLLLLASGLLGCASAAKALKITEFKNGYLTFSVEDPSLFYRVEFKPNLTDSVDWDGSFHSLRNIQTSEAEVTVPVGVFYRVVGRETPWIGGTASASDILVGKSAFVEDDAIEGTMPNIGQQTFIPGTAPQTISLGFHDGTGSVVGDAALAAGNIVTGATIFEVEGTALQASGDAQASHVLSGKTFSRDGAVDVSGTMPNIGQQTFIPGTAPQTISLGYHDGTGVVEGDADLTPENIALGVNIFGVTGTFEGMARVPKTGQDGARSNRARDDGSLQVGAAWPNPRFTDNGDETVTDNLTGLMWTKNSNLPGGVRNWADAVDYCTDMNAGAGTFGYTDWRLPNVKELQSLINYGNMYPAMPVPTAPFTGVESGAEYWSSSTFDFFVPYASDDSWWVDLRRGRVDHRPKTDAYQVWPVRGGL